MTHRNIATALLFMGALSLIACEIDDGKTYLDTSDTQEDTNSTTNTNTNTDTDTGVDPRMPIFLMAGQSNIEGNVDETLFNDLINEFDAVEEGTVASRLEKHLSDWYHNWNEGYAMYGYSAEVVAFEARELIRLNAAGLVNAGLTTPYPEIYCSLNETEIAPLAINCGHPFGPELVLGHILGATPYSPTSLIKVADGGTNLYTHWRSPSAVAHSGGVVGELYTKLQSKIRILNSKPGSLHPECALQECRWGAFIWFQGENDCFDEINAQSYEQNLTYFLADVRNEIGSPTLPVIIVEIGAWAQGQPFGDIVTAAQRSVVDADPYAEIVTTNDLSSFYHYDAAAQLIMGERIALALRAMLD
jgi:hypothetical protein